jgi:BrnA antitoxin of type II toxin-antitoxin system
MNATPCEKLEIDPVILAWFRARGRGWQDEINGVLEFYIETIEHPAADTGLSSEAPWRRRSAPTLNPDGHG